VEVDNKAKVSELADVIGGNKYVFRLDIHVHEVVIMKMLHSLFKQKNL